MSDSPTAQIFDDLFRYLEALETQNGAVLQLLRDRKLVDDQQFASYLEKAAVASDVKWRAARVRMEHLLATVPEPAKQPKVETKEETKEVPKKEEQAPAASTKKESQAAPEEKTAPNSESGEMQWNAPPDRPMTPEKSAKVNNSQTVTETRKKEAQAGDKQSAEAVSEAHQNASKPREQEPRSAQPEETAQNVVIGPKNKQEKSAKSEVEKPKETPAKQESENHSDAA